MVNYQIEKEIDTASFIKHFYKKRGFVFRVAIFVMVLSLLYSFISSMLNPPMYKYTSRSVIDMSIGEDAEYQKPMFISYLGSQKLFNESAKSIGLEASYAIWRDSVVIEEIKDSTQISFKISSIKTDKLVELNRRIVSNAIFQTSNILIGLNVQTVEDAELLDDVVQMRQSVNYFGNLFIFTLLGLLTAFGWLTLQVIVDRKIKRAKDVEFYTGLPVIGTIPDLDNLIESEEINVKNFVRGLIWKKRK
jgi:capsular polysaccharide biosynthesis protein